MPFFSGNYMKNETNDANPIWVEAELRLADSLDSRMIGLLKAIDETGSINQAAKQVGLSYKGAWQMIERANNLSPKVLISTATGGSKGGGTCLTSAGRALLQLFTRIEQQHQAFLKHLNQSLASDPDMMLLLKPLTIKTSATNQLFGTITVIKPGAVTTEVFVALKGGLEIVASLTYSELNQLGLTLGSNVLLLINASEINVVIDPSYLLSARNCLFGRVIRIQRDAVDSEVVLQLTGGDSIVATITQHSAELLNLKLGASACAIFKSNAVILGTMGHASNPSTDGRQR
jgi:molybdate transport system regulatory protein